MEQTLETLETLDIIAGLDSAIRLLEAHKGPLAPGSFTLWRLVKHAIEHLDRQVEELMKPPEPESAA